LVVLASLLACSDDESTNGAGPTTTNTATASSTASTGGQGGDGGGTGGSTGGSGGMGMGPGTITIVASGISGEDGSQLIASVLQGATKLGGTCETINGGAASAVAKEVDRMDVCMLGNDVVFPEGTYDVAAGIYPPSSPSPTLCAATQVTVAGNTQVTLPAFSTCQ
jgi:hypothetical protein